MTRKRRCQECGAEIADEAPGGACPVCALRDALRSGSDETPEELEQAGTFAGLYASHTALTARQFGDYEILEEIARGGMGVVYRARQLSLNRPVALKMILSGGLATEAEVKRFQAEAEAIARLHHPNIVAIHEIGFHEGRHFFSMDFVAGKDLDALVRDGPLPAAEAARLLEAVARAIHYAHQQGILHRDLKPSNVLLDGQGQPRVTDFGLAKQMGSDADLTLSGQVLGSPNFMPPEQATGRKAGVGPQSDVYSLGAILYHLLTGRPPFLAESLQATLAQVLQSEPISLRALNGRVPADLETICLKCLEKAPAQRYQTAQELAEELGRFRRGEPILARPISQVERGWRWCRRNPALGAALAATALLLVTIAVGSTVAAWRIAAARDAEKVQRVRAETNEAQDREHLVRLKVAAGWQMVEQGQWFDALAPFAEALEADKGDVRREEAHRTRIAMLLQNGPHLERMWFPGGPLTHIELSPDGKRVLTATASWQGHTNLAAAQIWDLATGTALSPPMFHAARINIAAFSPDGTRVVTASEDKTAQVWEAATGGALGPPLRHSMGVTDAAFSPDGLWVATCARYGTSDSNGCVEVWNSRSGACQFIDKTYGRDAQLVLFIPGSQQVLAGSSFYHCELFDFNTQKSVGNVPDCWKTPAAVCSPDGHSILIAGAFGHNYQPGARLFDTRTWQALTPLLPHSDGYVYAAAFSPDGRMMATGGTDHTAQLWDVSTGFAVVPPMQHTGPVTSTQFSPDSHKLLTASRDGTARVWNTESGLPDCPPLKQSSPVCQALFALNGQEVVTGCDDGTVRVWALAPAFLAQKVILNDGQVRCARFSPDGRWIATGDSGGLIRLWDTGTLKPVFAPLSNSSGIRSIKFCTNGLRVLVHCQDWAAHTWDLSGENPKPMGRDHTGSSADFSPDGSLEVCADLDKLAQMWDVKTGVSVGPNFGSQVDNPSFGGTPLIRFSPDGHWIGVANYSGAVEIWDASTIKRLPFDLVHESAVNDLCFSPDDRWIVTVSDDNTARIWDRQTGLPTSPPLHHVAPVRFAAFSPDGRMVVTASDDGTARLWTSPAGNPVGQPMLHHDDVNEAHFSPDGHRVATASSDGSARVWDAETGEALTAPLVHGGKVWTVDFSPDGRWLLTASEDQTARLWRLPEANPILPDLPSQVLVLAAMSIDGTSQLSLPQAWSNLKSRNEPSLGVLDSADAGSEDPAHQPVDSHSAGLVPSQGASNHPARAGDTAGDFLPQPPQAVSTYSDSPILLSGLQLAEKQGDFTKSVRLLNRLMEIDGENWLLLYRRACAKARLTDYVGAVADYTRALEIKPDAAVCWLGRYLARSGQSDTKAPSDFRESLQRARGFRVHGNMPQYDQITPADPSLPGQWETVAQNCTAGLHLSSQNADLLCARGVAEAAQFRWTAASRDFEQAARLRPTQEGPWLALALTYSKLADRNDDLWPQVLAASRHALTCQPEDPMAQSLQDEATSHTKPK